MRVVVPITGELITPEGGNPDNPVRPIDFTALIRQVSVESSDFSWEALNYDFENGVVELEISFEKGHIPTEFGADGSPTAFRLETDSEFNQRRTKSENALHSLLKEHTIGKLHQMTGELKLIRPFKEKK